MFILDIFKRNPCLECCFYRKENNTCQSKKCATGGAGYVGLLDRLFCEPFRDARKKEAEHGGD